MTGRWELAIIQPNVPLSTNAANRMHHRPRHVRLSAWRDMTMMMARQALRTGAWKDDRPVPPFDIQVVLKFRVRSRRDPHNYVGTNVKSMVDGLVRAGVMPDDNPEWATVLEPRLVVEPSARPLAPLTAHIILTPRST